MEEVVTCTEALLATDCCPLFSSLLFSQRSNSSSENHGPLNSEKSQWESLSLSSIELYLSNTFKRLLKCLGFNLRNRD